MKTRIHCTSVTPEHVVYDCFIKGFIHKYYFTIVVNKELDFGHIISTKKERDALFGKMRDTYGEMQDACVDGARFIFNAQND